MAKNDPYAERVREVLADWRADAGLLPEFMSSLAADEVEVALALVEHGEDFVAVYRATGISVQDVASVCNRKDVGSAVNAIRALLDASFDTLLGGLRRPFFAALYEGLHSTKDRTRIEFARMAANLFEKQESRAAKILAAQKEVGGDASVAQLAKGLDGLTDEQLAAIIAQATATLH